MLLSRVSTATRILARPRAAPLASFLRYGSSQTVRSTAALIDPAVLSRDDGSKSLHGRYASIAPPTRAKTIPQPEFTEVEAADHAWRQTNHIWSNDELDKVSIEKHEPVTMSDHFMKGVMNALYHGFNFVTGYDPVDPSPRSVAWRLIILESFAGVPGFVAAGFRHFYSLRTLKRDHGAIYTFLEEAENVRASEQ